MRFILLLIVSLLTEALRLEPVEGLRLETGTTDDLPEEHANSSADERPDSNEEAVGVKVADHHTVGPDPAKNSHSHAAQAGEHHSHMVAETPFTIALLLFIGIATKAFVSRYCPSIPYTCVLFLEGCLVSWIENEYPRDWIHMSAGKDIAKGIDLIQASDPHFVLCVFLPPLLFADAMDLNIAMLRRCLWQCLLLAVPGVLIGTALTGVAAHYCLPYKWDWLQCFLFGSILSATDPVAVVAIFRSIGVSPRLTMLIGGESLFNDGTAVMIFQLLLEIVEGQGDVMSTERLSKFLTIKIAVAPIVGLVVGKAFVRIIQWTSVGSYADDKTLQIVTTVCCCYMGYVISEAELGSSGVIAVVVTGIVFAGYAKPIFLSSESIHTVWLMLEFIGNTLIFMISGVIFGNSFSSYTSSFQPKPLDFGLLALVYVLANLIRGVSIMVLAKPLNLVGHTINWRELLVMTWCGLRGAVGLLMAVVVNDKKNLGMPQTEFFVGGFAALTLLINGMLTPLLLTQLGMRRVSTQQTQMLAEVENMVLEKVRAHVEEQLGSAKKAMWYSDVTDDKIIEALPKLQTVQSPKAKKQIVIQDQSGERDEAKMEMLRTVLLRCVRNCYQQLGKEYIIPKGCPVSRILFNATNFAMLSCDLPLSDWELAKEELMIGVHSNKEDYDRDISPWKQSLGLSWTFEKQQIYQAVACIAFSYAHTESAKMVCSFYGHDVSADTAEEKKVCEESQRQVDLALHALQSMPPGLLSSMKTKMLATSTLVFQLEKMEHLTHLGVMSETDNEKMAEPYHEALRELIQDVHG